MAYTKDYYHILSLDAPGWHQPANETNKTAAADLRRAYKIALLAAHPDKKKQDGIATTKTKPAYTVDDVKEAYTILADPKTRAEYYTWFLHNRHMLRSSNTTTAMAIGSQEQAQAISEDFILGLELVDLSDFDEVEPTTTSTSKEEEREEGVEWTRACRCGDEKGFRIVEDELEDAQVRGDNEVLVGCQGCSLWLRVGFEVQEG